MRRNEADPCYEKFYTLHHHNVKDAVGCKKIIEEMFPRIFSDTPLILKVLGDSFTGAAAKFLDELKAVPNVHS